MKKNENGVPIVADDCECLNAPRNRGALRTPTNLNGQRSENGDRVRQKEGCSRGSDVTEIQGKNGENKVECDDIPLAYVYAPEQKFCMLYSASEALKHGTLFENLYKPLGVYGRE